MLHEQAVLGLRPGSRRSHLRGREASFNNRLLATSIPKYNPLYDGHLNQLWASSTVRSHLQTTGFMDKAGDLVDVDTHHRKLFVIEQELAQADRIERDRRVEKERRIKDRQTLAKRQEMHEKHLRDVKAERERKAAHRKARGSPPLVASSPSPRITADNMLVNLRDLDARASAEQQRRTSP